MRSKCIKMLIITICIFSLNVHAAIVQWKVVGGGNGHYYEAVLNPGISWDEANSLANAKGNGWHLATITSAQENLFVISMFSNIPEFKSNRLHSNLAGWISNGPWIGGYSSTRTSNDLKWVTGEPFTNLAWGPYEPFGNGEKLVYSFFESKNSVCWNDMPNTYTSAPPTGYIIENATTPEPSILSLITVGVILARKKRRNCFFERH